MVTARSRRLEYSERTRKALVDSAVKLFTDKGYAGTSLDEIARRARVTKGALYHHFGGKQELFEAAEHHSFGVLRAAVTVLVEAGEIEDMPIEVTTRLLFGSMSAAAVAIGTSADPKKTSAEVEHAMRRVLDGLRSCQDSGDDPVK